MSTQAQDVLRDIARMSQRLESIRDLFDTAVDLMGGDPGLQEQTKEARAWRLMTLAQQLLADAVGESNDLYLLADRASSDAATG